MSEMVETRLKKVIKENYKDIADNIRLDETLAEFGRICKISCDA